MPACSKPSSLPLSRPGHITLDDPLGTDTFANGINND